MTEQMRDIGKRDRSHREAIFDQIADFVLVVSASGGLIDWNGRVSDVTGYSDEEIAQIHLVDLLPEKAGGLPGRILEKLDRDRNERFEADVLTKGGESVSYEFTARVCERATERLVCLTGRGAENSAECDTQIRGSEELLSRVLEQLPVYTFIQDENLQYTWVSKMPLAEESRALLGKTDRDVLPPAEARRMEEIKRQVLESGNPARAEFQVTVSGRQRWYDSYLAPIRGDDGQPIGVVGGAVNITPRKEAKLERMASRQRYRQLFEAARTGIAIHTLEGKIVDINPAGLEMLGYTKRELEMLDRDDIYPYPRQVRRAARMIKEEGELSNLEVTLRRKDGEHIVCLLSSTAQTNEAGEIERFFTLFRDITELKQYQDQFRLLIDEVEEYAIFMLDPQGRIITWNEGARQIMGYDRDEILGRNLSVLYTEEGRAGGEPESTLRRAAADGRVERQGWRVRKDGTYFWVRASLTAVHDEQGNLRGYAKVARDLTDQRQRERELRASEARYRRLFEMSQEGIGISTPEGRLIDVNSAGQEILGYTKKELREISLEELYVDSEERRTGREQLAEEGWIRNMEVTIRRKDGEEIICRLSSTAVRESDGEPEVFQTFFQDITDQKRAQEALEASEERFRRLFMESRDAVIVTVPDGEILSVNAAATELFGYSEEEFLDMEAEELYEYPLERRLRIVPTLLDSYSSRLLEAKMRRKDGSTFLASASVTVHRDEDGSPELMQAIVRDITRQRRLKEQLLEIQETERQRIGQELHDGVASQLIGAKLIGENLTRALEAGEEVQPSELEELTEIVRESAQQTRLISQGINPISLGEDGLLGALERLADRTDEHSDLTCSFEVDGHLPDLHEQNSAHLYRFAQEAVNNALKHAEAARIEIRLTGDNGMFELSVSDNGKGLPRDAFEQEEGLGMHTMRYRADIVGGRFEVSSEPDEGTIVRCRVADD